MPDKYSALIISSALLSSSIIFHAWYPIQHGPEAARLDWISKCVAIRDDGSIRLSDIPEREPVNLLAEESTKKQGQPVNKIDEAIATAVSKSRFEIEQNCMATYAIVMRGGR